jgi:hypothetical protein
MVGFPEKAGRAFRRIEVVSADALSAILDVRSFLAEHTGRFAQPFAG